MATNKFLDAVNSNLYNNSIAIGGTSYNTDYLRSEQGKALLAELEKKAATNGYTTFNGIGTGDSTKLGSSKYNSDGSIASNSVNNYTFGQEGAAIKAMQNGDSSPYNALGVNMTDANGNAINSGNSTAQQTNPQSNILAEIEKAKAAKISSRNAALQGVLDKTNTALGAEKATIAPQYQTLKNNESSTAQLRAKRVGEIMAQKGYSEGYQGQDEIARNVEYQGNIGNYKAQEQNAYNDIAKRGTDAQTEYNTGLATAQSDADTTASEQRLAELGTERDYARADEQTQYNRSQDTLTNDRIAEQDKIAAEDKQKQEFVATIGQHYKDYTQVINDIANDNDTSNDWQLPYLKAARTEKVAAQEAAQATAIAKQQADQNTATKLAYDQAFNRWKTAGVVNSSADAKILGVNVGTKTEQYAQDQMSNSIAQQKVTTSAAKASSSSSSSANKATIANTYQQAVTAYNNMLPGTALNNLQDYSNEIIAQIGSANYNKLVELTKDRLYETTVSNYNDFPATTAYNSAINNKDHIIGEIGAANYNKLLAKLKSRYDAANK